MTNPLGATFVIIHSDSLADISTSQKKEIWATSPGKKTQFLMNVWTDALQDKKIIYLLFSYKNDYVGVAVMTSSPKYAPQDCWSKKGYWGQCFTVTWLTKPNLVLKAPKERAGNLNDCTEIGFDEGWQVVNHYLSDPNKHGCNDAVLVITVIGNLGIKTKAKQISMSDFMVKKAVKK